MKVTDVKTFAVDCFRTNWVFVKVYTDEGIDGVGEATLEYKEKALIGAVEHIKEYLVGKDPRDVEKHFHDIYRDAYWRGGATWYFPYAYRRGCAWFRPCGVGVYCYYRWRGWSYGDLFNAIVGEVYQSRLTFCNRYCGVFVHGFNSYYSKAYYETYRS